VTAFNRNARVPERQPGGNALRVEALELAYGPVRALHGVSVEVPPGSVVAVLGSNGAGKTSLMRAVSGTHRLHRGRVLSGRIWLGDTDLTSLSPPQVVGHGVVQVPEGRRVFGRLSVAENLEAGAIWVRASSEEQLEQVHELFPVLAVRPASPVTSPAPPSPVRSAS
jgi:branched-chain amino acid transport system ATP-binding protein